MTSLAAEGKRYDVVCTACRCWRGREPLSAKHPFIKRATILGCPYCKAAGHITRACECPECDLPASCGTNADVKWKNTCLMHVQREAYDGY